MKYLRFISFAAFLLHAVNLFSIDYQFHENLKWLPLQSLDLPDGTQMFRPVFEKAVFENNQEIPVFSAVYPVHTTQAVAHAVVSSLRFERMTGAENEILIPYKDRLNEIRPEVALVTMSKEPWVSVRLVPVRWNDSIQSFEKLISFDLHIEITDVPERESNSLTYTTQSVLSTGNWFKVRVSESGMHQITYSDLSAMGFDLNTSTTQLAVFGYGGGLLPEKNDAPFYDDLVENPILVDDGGDGKMDQGDKIIFYAQGPVTWHWNTFDQVFNHQNNYYDDYAYYFVTSLSRPGKRIENMNVPEGSPEVEVADFIDYACHEVDTRNLAGMGRTWFGELYDLSSLSHDYVFSFPNIIKTTNAGYLKGAFASKAGTSNSFKIAVNGTEMATLSMPLTTSYYDYGKEGFTDFRFLPKDDNIIISTSFLRTETTAVGYLNYIELNARRSLIMVGSQMPFRNAFSQPGLVAQYALSEAGSGVQIWDVTVPVAPKRIVASSAGNQLQFKAVTGEVNEYIAFNNTEFKSVEFVELVANQNIHGLRNIDYLIVSHPDFTEEAERLAAFHREHAQWTVEVVDVNQVYNEFASGSHDITALRNLAKMLYDASDPGSELKYMLLFGDASYDYKGRLGNFSNFVPCWESSTNSLNIVNCIATDDYFGYLDDGEGIEGATADRVDIGIGRFVVATPEEAVSAVDKTINYSVNTDQVMGAWRNVITFVADDGDSNIHMGDAEKLSNFLGENYPVYNINKIYTDAYNQISTPGGQKAPDVNRAINLQMDKGTLIFNYSGHGGEIGLGHEQIVQIPDINSWSNFDKLAVFITATCEFTRYDDPSRVSAGEQVFLNQKGGAIALLTTSRATFASANLALNMDIYEDNMFEKVNGAYPTFGDIIRKSKRRGSSNDRKFILVGDPACRMAYPEYRAETTEITVNDNPAPTDTIRALDMVQVKGRIVDQTGSPMSDYQGEMYPLVYDKMTEIVTYGDESSPRTFYLRKNVLFNGKCSVNNGDFTFEFMMPKDIAYQYGPGRISYYFKNESTDGHGYYEDFIVGGFNPEAIEDTIGPDISLFMFDTTFVPGNIVNQNPLLLALVSDESGINTTGAGIGHDIVSILDENPNQSFVLNDYYEADENSFNSGSIRYPFADLDEGEHVLSLKVWDVYNNSSMAYLPFIVVSSSNVIVENLRNFPNPFVGVTKFTFSHNQSGKELDVALHIYGMNGMLVTTLNTKIDAEGYQIDPLEWDGTADNGGKIGRGFYVCHLVVRNSDGQTGFDQSKLLYIK